MTQPSLRNAGLLALLLLVAFFSFWEYHIRSTVSGISYDDGQELWNDKRMQVYAPPDQATVFIGSSRHKYDIDQPTWQALTGEKVVQLAFEGTSPMPALDDLAADSFFKGKLIFDVTEGLVYNTNPQNLERVQKAIEYSKKVTPAQKFSFKVNRLLESQFAFLDKDYFSLSSMLQRAGIPARAGVPEDPYFPIDFGRIDFNRQNHMTTRFLHDTNLQGQVKGIWAFYGRMAAAAPPPPDPKKSIDSILAVIQKDVSLIKARGGRVLFVRSPSSGPLLEIEKHVFPRAVFWEPILTMTGSPGIYFEDYPSLNHFQCPEFSHLSPTDAIDYTKSLVAIIEHDKGWSFPNKTAAK